MTASFSWPERIILAVAVVGALGTVGLLAADVVLGVATLDALRSRASSLAIDGLVIWAVWLTASLRATRRRVAALQGRALTEQWGPR